MSNRILRICNKLLLLVTLGSLGGCALSKQKELFPEIYATKELPTQLDVLIDVTVLGDLHDKDLGIDPERNRAAADHALERVSGIMGNAGYELHTVRSGYGLAWRPGTESVYLTEGKKATAFAYTGPGQLNPGDPWIADHARDFLQTLVMASRGRRGIAEDMTSQLELWALAHSPLPSAFMQLQSRYLLVVHMTVYDASAWKEAASIIGGIALGMGMAAAGSTLVLVPILRTSYTWAELVLYDTRTGDIAWAKGYNAPDDGEDDQRVALSEAAATFPAHAGRKATYPRRDSVR